MRSFLVVSLLSAFATASPLGLNIFERAVSPFCSTVSQPCNAATQTSAVTSFCSSYLSVPLATATVTTSTTSTIVSTSTNTGWVTSKAPPRTVTKESTSTILVTKTTTKPTTVTRYTSTAYTTTYAPSITFCFDPRDTNRPVALEARAVAKPTCLSKYSAAAQITSACSCYTIPKRTTISTVTSTSTTTSWTTVQSGKTTTVTPLTTALITKSITSTRLNTVYTTTTISTALTSTSTIYPVDPTAYDFVFGVMGRSNPSIHEKYLTNPNPNVPIEGHDDRDEFSLSMPIFSESRPVGRTPSTLFTWTEKSPAIDSGHITPVTGGIEPGGSDRASLYNNGNPRIHIGSIFARDNINCRIVGQEGSTCGLSCWDPYTFAGDTWNDCNPNLESQRDSWMLGNWSSMIGYGECRPFVPWLITYS